MTGIGIIPVFPLSAVVFPGEELLLHIFEPRYKQLIIEQRDAGGSFGIPFVQGKNVKELGVEVRLKTIYQVHPEGEMDIAVQGLGVFELDEIFNTEERLYSYGRIWRRNAELDRDLETHLQAMRPLLEQFLSLKSGEVIQLPQTQPESLYAAATLLNLHPNRKYDMLQQETPEQRFRWLQNEIKLLIGVRQMELKLQKNYLMN